MGDFNIDWSQSSGEILSLLTQYGLTSVNTTIPNLVTFPSSDTRLDWIFVTPELFIESEKILTQDISDHYAVIATIRRKQAKTIPKP